MASQWEFLTQWGRQPMATLKIREYEVIEGPSVGTFGKTYIGIHEVLGKKRALKQLHSYIRSKVIEDEARKLMEVKSPYVIHIHEYFNDQGNETIVMEYCPTGLDAYLKDRFAQTKGHILYQEARQLLYAVLQGLNDAHKAGIIHGDIKPANVRFGEDQLPKLGDFGAARRLGEKIDPAKKIPDAATSLRGSTNWMAPELFKGEPATEESDYFSFGILAYLVLSGCHPFFSSDPSCLTSEEDNIVSKTFKPVPLKDLRKDIPSKVADLILELLSEPGARKTAEISLKAALSEQLEDTVTVPGELVAQVRGLTQDEAESLAKAYQGAKHTFFSLFRPKEAVDELTEFLEHFRWERFKDCRFDGLADAWSLRAFINNSAGLFNEAIKASSNAISVNPKHVNSLHSRGYAYIQQGRYEEAERDLTEALNLAEESHKRAQIRRLLDTIKFRK
jgi:serine/threonine protein kinase